jgi:hypothetical protein
VQVSAIAERVQIASLPDTPPDDFDEVSLTDQPSELAIAATAANASDG